MLAEVALVAAAAFVVAACLTGAARRLALRRGVMDIPNERSSHAAPTPRGGGIAIVFAATIALIVLATLRIVPASLAAALCGGGIAVAAIGFQDDRRGVSPTIRLLVHFGAAVWALYWLGGLPPLRVGFADVDPGWPGNVTAVLGIVWTVNLFNFMDGIDGIAASEALFVAFGGGALALLHGGMSPEVAAAAAFGAACCGFLVWNWPPAKIFLGDVGSGYLGYIIAVLALAATRSNSTAVWIWLVLGGVFFVDATLTLLRRMLRGESVYQAHRSHAYQWLARRWRSHGRVTGSVWAVNILWLLPSAWLAAIRYDLAPWIVVVSLIPVGIVAVLAGSGRPEARRTDTHR